MYNLLHLIIIKKNYLIVCILILKLSKGYKTKVEAVLAIDPDLINNKYIFYKILILLSYGA